jgi:hypothetical protein
MTETSSSWSNDMFFRALLHILARELGIKDIKPVDDSLLWVVRHAVFLSSAVHQLMIANAKTQRTQQEHQGQKQSAYSF